MNINGTITGDFENYVLGDPMYMHEYGHVIDGRGWGPLYLFAVGIPSLISVAGDGDHSRYWTEIRANRRARSYFGRYYGINWNFSGYPLN